jgi:spore coat protein U-like protein
MALFAGDRAMAQSCSSTDADGSFGTINILGGVAIDSTANFTVTCSGTPHQTVRLCLEFERGAVNAAGERVMIGPEQLRLEFYTDPARTTIWGSWGSAAAIYVPYPYGKQVDLSLGPSGNASTVQTVYASIFGSQQLADPGWYGWFAVSPKFRYGYAGAQNCPTGGPSANGGITLWLARIADACNVSATNISFGSIAALSAIVDATGTITVQCTQTTAYNVGLNAGTGAGATVTTRKMTAGTNTVDYSLYRNSSRTQVWGTTIGTDTIAGTGSGANQNLTAYGRIPVQTTPPPATYNDTITVTVTY